MAKAKGRPERLRAAVELRLSKDTDESTSIERTDKICRDYCAGRNWDVVLVPEPDINVSATHVRPEKRPGLKEILSRLDDIDVIVFYRLDRFVRSLSDFVRLVSLCEAHNVALASATEPLDMTTPMGRAMAYIMAIFAELEARNTSDRVTSANEYMRSVGRHRGGSITYGWQSAPNPDGNGYVLVAEPHEASVIRDTIIPRILRRESAYSIAKHLNDQGEKRRGYNWNAANILELLRNPELIGIDMHDGETVKDPETGLPVRLCEPLIDVDLFDELQAEIKRRSNPRGRRTNTPALITGMTCSRCGSRHYLTGGQGRMRYGCSGAANKGNGCSVSVSQPRADEYVSEVFLSRYGDWIRVDSPPPPVDTSELRDELARTETAIDDLTRDRYERGLYEDEPERYADIYRRLRARKEALSAEIATLAPGAEADIDLMELNTVAEEWEQTDHNGRRQLLAMFLDSAEVQKGQHGRKFSGAERLKLQWIPDRCDDFGELLAADVMAKAPEGHRWYEEARARMQARWSSRPVKTGTLLEQYAAFEASEGGTGDTGDDG